MFIKLCDWFDVIITLRFYSGKMEERKGNFTAAREFYSLSLNIRASAPTLVSQALLELKHPSLPFTDEDALMPENPNITLVRSIFEEALLVDPRHGPAYNAYGASKCEFRQFIWYVL